MLINLVAHKVFYRPTIFENCLQELIRLADYSVCQAAATISMMHLIKTVMNECETRMFCDCAGIMYKTPRCLTEVLLSYASHPISHCTISKYCLFSIIHVAF